MAEEKNMVKYERYRGQFKRLDRALEDRFYLEAIFIEYALLEDKAWSALQHGFFEGCEKRAGLDRKIDAIKELRKADELAAKHIGSKLLGDIKSWKNDRNRLVHNLIETDLNETAKLRGLAVRGKRLAGEFGNKVSSYNRAVARRARD